MSTIHRNNATGKSKPRKPHAKTKRPANRAAAAAAAEAGAPAEGTGASRRWLDSAVHAVRVLVALLLMTAAAIKFHQHAVTASVPTTTWDIVQVAGEWALGLWLLSAWKLHVAWLVTLGLFTLFTGYSLRQGIAGAETCGCFGPVAVSPWLMLGVDLLVIAALAALHLPVRARQAAMAAAAAKKPAAPRRLRMAPAAALAVLVLITAGPAGIAMALAEPARAAAPTALTDPPRDHYLEPEKWVGQPLPILSAIDVQGELAIGRWTVLFYRHTCPACHEAIDSWLASVDGQPGAGTSGGRLALIEVPPLDGQPDDAIVLAKELGFLHGRLAPQHRWFFTTPTVVQLEQGRVVHVGRDPLARWAGSGANVAATPAVAAPPQVNPAPAPEIVAASHATLPADATPFQQPEPFDFGYVAAGGVKEAAITIRNNLDRDLPIRRVQVECVCTQVLAWPELIPAGGEAELHLRFEAFEQPQHYAKHVMLLTDDPHVPRIELPLRARIGLPLAIEPTVLEAPGSTTPGSSEMDAAAAEADAGPPATDPLALVIRNDGPVPVRLLYSTANVAGLIAPVPREPIAPGSAVTLQVTVPADLPRNGRIQIVTDAEHQNHLHVPVRKAGP